MAELRELTTDAEWERAVPILRQLWSYVDEAFVRSWRDEDDYRLLGWFAKATGGDADARGASAESLVAVAGVYVQTVVHHERSLWIHDLVVDEAHRGEGHGEALLDALETWGETRDCDHVALVCAADNDEAAAFYEHVGMEPFGTVYEREL
ncbi:GCN5-like N-acetyltransferase [Salinarchaeum sp. Harcht-Bsk1]|uniref:GNAT family N-acetyltransferase n=1 Tax=Salinarchaeum sp. Harcht-Bsk1 TaxID=1333523 RepID=UPI0003422CB3|nr:GNAT family N-acetyltransferase [Salinarchaeum sp. Harcht-Bsk1]AGN01428.1 GCN5-like N-acetyltransferase [Salinarchaeum sp. Harcht-Bsk1]